MKKVVVTVTQVIEVPDSADVIPMKDNDGTAFRQLKYKGNLFMPCISWMEYQPSYRECSTFISPDDDGWHGSTTLTDEVENQAIEEDYLIHILMSTHIQEDFPRFLNTRSLDSVCHVKHVARDDNLSS